jgi:hypothetical protein
MIDKIKYTYIPKNHIDSGMTQILFSRDVVYSDMTVIDNAALGVSIEPELKGMVRIATPATLDSAIIKAIHETECDTLILNGFDISLDDVRDKYVKIAKEYDILLCINVISDISPDSNISVNLDVNIDKLSDEEWRDTKEELMNETKDKFGPAKSASIPTNIMSSLFGYLAGDNDGLKISEAAKKLDETEGYVLDLNILETYTCCKNDEELTVHKLDGNKIIISDGDNEIIFDKSLLNFLTNSLSNID